MTPSAYAVAASGCPEARWPRMPECREKLIVFQWTGTRDDGLGSSGPSGAVGPRWIMADGPAIRWVDATARSERGDLRGNDGARAGEVEHLTLQETRQGF
jgi:hypothetical protein